MSSLANLAEQSSKFEGSSSKMLLLVDAELTKLKSIDRQKSELNSFFTKCENETRLEVLII